MPWTVSAVRRAVLAGAVALACLALSAPQARADADPASDALLIQDIFFPYQPMVSAGVASALNQVVAEAKAAHFPVKVALISGPEDLGGLPNLFAQPQRYADFLDREISYNAPVALLVVMPQGFGTHSLGKQGELNPLLPVNPAPGSDGLAKAAIAAVLKLAADAGHPLAAPKIVATKSKSGGGTSPALTFGAPVLLVLIAAGGVALTRRRRGDEEESVDA
jgi:ABC-type glycerol-3-phosphate transport system substrate-binding protein